MHDQAANEYPLTPYDELPVHQEPFAATMQYCFWYRTKPVTLPVPNYW